MPHEVRIPVTAEAIRWWASDPPSGSEIISDAEALEYVAYAIAADHAYISCIAEAVDGFEVVLVSKVPEWELGELRWTAFDRTDFHSYHIALDHLVIALAHLERLQRCWTAAYADLALSPADGAEGGESGAST